MNRYEAYQQVLQQLSHEQLVNVAAANLMILDKCSDVIDDGVFLPIAEECQAIIPNDVAEKCWNITEEADNLLAKNG